MNERITEDIKWIICMWDVRGESDKETAMLLKLKLQEVRDVIAESKSNGYYDKVRRHIERFDAENAMRALRGFASFLADGSSEGLGLESYDE